MFRLLTRQALLPLLLLSLLAAGCADSGSIAAPESRPSFGTEESEYTPVPGRDGDELSVSAVIDAAGGSLALGGHVLTVPAGAVSGPTTFQMELTYEDKLGVKLSATSVGSSVHNDIGAAGFLTPVVLRMSFEKATREVNPGRLTVAWERDEDELEPVSSSVDMSTKTVSGLVPHFSGFILAD